MVKSEWTRRRLLRAGAMTCVAASLSPATSWAKSKDVAYITPFGKIVAYAPDFIASAGGYFDSAGVNVEIIGGNGSAQAIQLVAAGKALNNPKDMAGKTIGIVSRGGGTDNYLDIMLTSAGLAKDSVTRQVAGNSPGAFDLVELGRLDAFIADESVLIALRRAGK